MGFALRVVKVGSERAWCLPCKFVIFFKLGKITKTLMKPSPCVVLFVLCSGLSLCQEQGETRKTPATKLEAFQARTGAVLIRGYSTVGTLRGEGSDVSVDAREFRDGSNPNSPKAMGGYQSPSRKQVGLSGQTLLMLTWKKLNH